MAVGITYATSKLSLLPPLLPSISGFLNKLDANIKNDVYKKLPVRGVFYAVNAAYVDELYKQ